MTESLSLITIKYNDKYSSYKSEEQKLLNKAETEKGKRTLKLFIEAKYKYDRNASSTRKEIENALNKHERGILLSIGINSYNDKEIEKALWDQINHYNFSDIKIELLNIFISNFNNSKRLKEAYYLLGCLHALDPSKSDNKSAIDYFKIIIDRFPSSEEALKAQCGLIDLYMRTGDHEKALKNAEIWLNMPFNKNIYKNIDKFMVYPVVEMKNSTALSKNSFFHPSKRSYFNIKKCVLFAKAYLHHQLGNYKKAEKIYRELICLVNKKKDMYFTNIGEQRLRYYLTDITKGALGQLYIDMKKISESKMISNRSIWLENYQIPFFNNKINHIYNSERKKYLILYHIPRLINKIQHVYDSDGKYNKVAPLFKKILKHSKLLSGVVLNDLKEKTAFLRSKELRNPQEIVAFIEKLETDKILNLYCYNMADISVPSNEWLNTARQKRRLFLTLLSEMTNYKNIYLGLSINIKKIDKETKTISDNYCPIYKAPDGFFYKYDFSKTKTCIKKADSLELFKKNGFMEIEPISKKYRQMYDDGEQILKFDTIKIKLVKTFLRNGTLEALKKVFAKINGVRSDDNLFGIAHAFLLLPKTHFVGLDELELKEKGRSAGSYNSKNKNITLINKGKETAIHELTHHWAQTMQGTNYTILREPYIKDDIVNLFYNISWDTNNIDREIWGGYFGRVRTKRDDFDKKDFATDYALCNRDEDLAESGKDYVLNVNNLARSKVRVQMNMHNYEPATKYLYNKYIRSFDPTDGLVFEYNITKDDPPLSIAEVKKKMLKLLTHNPNLISKNTQNIIYKIEEEYHKLKSKMSE